VQAADELDLRSSERLDRALRVAVVAQSHNLAMHQVILEVAEECGGVDADGLRDRLEEGRARKVFDDLASAKRSWVKRSPFFLLQGSEVSNPASRCTGEDEHEAGFPGIDEDDPGVFFEDLIRVAAT
jgi:predicted DsbA family dithiol-disulfide isomerase